MDEILNYYFRKDVQKSIFESSINREVAVKFGGNRGFHIAVPFESFPSYLNKVQINLLFPDSAKIISSYLKNMIKDHLSEMISEKDSSKANTDPFSLVDIDSVAISSRHMFRAPYSYNEKSGLISVPVKDQDILNFNKEKALPGNVKTDIKFLDLTNIDSGESSQLIIQAYDWHHKTKNKKDFEEIEII